MLLTWEQKEKKNALSIGWKGNKGEWGILLFFLLSFGYDSNASKQARSLISCSFLLALLLLLVQVIDLLRRVVKVCSTVCQSPYYCCNGFIPLLFSLLLLLLSSSSDADGFFSAGALLNTFSPAPLAPLPHAHAQQREQGTDRKKACWADLN